MSTPEQGLERPADTASKATWLAYVERRTDITDTSGTRDQLKARVDQADAAAAATEVDPAERDAGGPVDPDGLALGDGGQADPADGGQAEPVGDPAAAPVTEGMANPAGTGGAAAGTAGGPGMVTFGPGDGGQAPPAEPPPAGPDVVVDPDERDPITPVTHHVVRQPDVPGGLGIRRAGGHVLTRRGWETEEEQPLDPRVAAALSDVPERPEDRADAAALGHVPTPTDRHGEPAVAQPLDPRVAAALSDVPERPEDRADAAARGHVAEVDRTVVDEQGQGDS